MAKSAITKYKNFLDYDEDYEYSTKIKSNRKNTFDDKNETPKKPKQKKFIRVVSQFDSYDD